MGVLFANNAASTLAAGIGTTTTVITLAAGEGAKFPSPGGSDWFPVVLQRIADYRQIEIARCTGRTGDQLTITRAQEGTAALTFVAGDIVDLRLTAAAIAAINADLLDGEQGSFYRNASNLNAGILPAARFNDTAHGSRGGAGLHAVATTSANGFMSSTDKSKLDGIAAGAQVNVGTDLGLTGTGNSRTVTSSTGNNVAIPVATASNAGFMATGDKSKLDGIEVGAQVNVATNLGQSRTATTYTVTSSTGNNTALAAATGTLAGVMSAADKTKLDSVESGAQANVGTNLGTTASSTTVTVTSSTGGNASIAAATTSVAGVMTAADKSKLNGIETGAQVNVATNLSRSLTSTTVTVTSSTGNNTSIPAATTSLAGVMAATDKSKLNGIETGAQVNVGTNLGSSYSATTVTVTSSTGVNVGLAGATTSQAGVMTAADKTKLNAVGTNANRNLTISTGEPTGGADGDVWYQYE